MESKFVIGEMDNRKFINDIKYSALQMGIDNKLTPHAHTNGIKDRRNEGDYTKSHRYRDSYFQNKDKNTSRYPFQVTGGYKNQQKKISFTNHTSKQNPPPAIFHSIQNRDNHNNSSSLTKKYKSQQLFIKSSNQEMYPDANIPINQFRSTSVKKNVNSILPKNLKLNNIPSENQ